ncbi:MAG: hypothetical protein H6822_12440 [Planctomycetaceae bacterium]|nr:hypothetical protein [Planctomycetales bacterium]MCB9922985.1 hypothetical protein [Planctomycetaceae bacterium]
MQYASTGSYPGTIDPRWFRGNKIPHHPLNDGEIPDVHVFSGHDRQHPSHKTLDNYGAYWYNRDIGVVRARVPYSTSSVEVLAKYNLFNEAALTSIERLYD